VSDPAPASLAAAIPPARRVLPAFGGVGIELEYAIVERESLHVLPLADVVLEEAGGAGVSGAAEVVRGPFGWSNELALHVIEIKNREPACSVAGLARGFATEVTAIDALLEKHGARLLPGGMHPWMHPASETRLWPHANADLYRQFDRLFDCARHGWSNLQSMHVNLPFADDEQFARLHAAIRLVLPIIPALAASSPFAGGVDSGHADMRLMAYRDNAARVPQITGAVIPQTVHSRAEYEAAILEPMYAAIAPYDPAGLLQHEWLNARGAIARFERDAIEIRLADTQECPRADIAVAAAITGVVRMLYREETAPLSAQQAMPTACLADILQRCITRAEQATLAEAGSTAYLALLGYPAPACSARQLWGHLIYRGRPEPGVDAGLMTALDHILEHGTLSTRLRRATHGDPSPARLHALYRRLADCLREDHLFGVQRPG
jgi:carboxylate-amine ligase